MNRLFNEPNGEWQPSIALDHHALLPEQIKKRRMDNADLRRAGAQKRGEKQPKWKVIDDLNPVPPWLGPVGAEFFRLASEEENEAKQYSTWTSSPTPTSLGWRASRSRIQYRRWI